MIMTKEEIENRIKEIGGEIKHLSEEADELQKKLKEIVNNENTESLLNEINDVNYNNSMTVRLYSDTRTTPIMDEFFNSDKKFLIFENIFTLDKKWTKISLVVTKGCKNVNVIDSQLTMTNLKSESGSTLGEYRLKTLSETSRFFPLVKEILTASTKITDKQTKAPFEIPIRLGGQTFANQTGYGSTYEGTYQVTQGTLYGDTTSFYIIGIIN